MPPYLVHRWAKLIGPEKVTMAYGMSEALGITTIRGDEYMTHEGSVGRPYRGTEVRILGPDGRDLPAGEVGDIYMRSDAYGGSTYLGEASQLPTTDDGFCTVGDVGYLDEEGYLYLVDRRVDLIISGGANVFPAEVEIALMDHPKVADVVVIGLKDAEWGRRVHAIIEPTDAADPPTFEEVRSYTKQRLATYKAPKSIEIVDAIPRSAATKVNRGALVQARGG
jgi:bile acid-coenzyme A ligase